MLGQCKVMRTKMMIGNPVYECLPTARSCARSGECHVMSWSSALLHLKKKKLKEIVKILFTMALTQTNFNKLWNPSQTAWTQI